MQRERLADYKRLDVEATASLEKFAAVELPVEAGWCYKISYRLKRGASFSALALRGLRGVVVPPKGNHRFSTRLGSRKLQFKRGKCYVLVIKLNRGASWSDAVARRNINVNFEGPSGGINAGPGVFGPGAISAPGCVFTKGAYALTMKADGACSSLGTGSASVKLYVRNAKRGELRRLEREEREQIEQSNRDMAETAREHCRKCRETSSTKEELETCAATTGQARNACY